MRENPNISEIYLRGMSDNTIRALIPLIAILNNLEKADFSFNYITAETALALVDALHHTPVKSLYLIENEFLTDQNHCPPQLARALLDFSPKVSLGVYLSDSEDSDRSLSDETSKMKLIADAAYPEIVE